MRYLKTNTATIVTVGPFFDKTDGVTLETALTITNERISATVDLNNGSAPTLVLDNVVGATSATDNDLNYIALNDAGLMQLELSAVNTNYLGRFFLVITDAANHVPVFHEFEIISAQMWDAMFGTGNLNADVVNWKGAAAPAMTGDAFARLGAPAGASVSADVAAVKADTAAILVDTGTTLDAALAVVDANVDAILVDTGTTLDAAVAAVKADTAAILIDTNATLDAKIDAILMDTGTTLDNALAAIKAETVLIVADTNELQLDWMNTGRLDTILDTAATCPTAAAIADAVWDEAAAGHVAAGSTGEKLNAAATAGDPWSTALPGTYGAGTAGKMISDIKTEVDAVLVDTGTTLDGKLSPLTLAAISDTVWDEPIADHGSIGTTGKELSDAAAAGSPPTAAQIADAVWDEAAIDHTTTGSFGAVVAAAFAAAFPTTTAIAAAVWAKIITGAVSAEVALANLYNGFSAYSEAGAGPGGIATTITVNVGGVPADGVEVWASTDIAGANVIAGTLITDAFGHAVFMLDAGTYYLWKQKAAINFTNPETIVVS